MEKGEVTKDFDNFEYGAKHNVVEITTNCIVNKREEMFTDPLMDYDGGFGIRY